MAGSLDDFPRTTHALRAALDARGVRPQRRHGQHFLTDVQAVDAIVRDARVGPADRVVEVGTGPGLLTHVLCETGARVVTFDVDAGMQALARELREWPERVTFVPGDVLAGKHALATAFVRSLEARAPPPGATLLVSNLPYGAATPILLGVLALPEPPDRLVVMVQAEVGAKLLAGVGEADYGAPSVRVGLEARGRILRRFGPQVFWPRPRVRSVLLELVPVRPSPLLPGEHGPFGAFVTALFTRRRKMLPAALAVAVPAAGGDGIRAGLGAAGIEPGVRAEALAPAQMLDLWVRLRVSA